jgi:phosphatidylserine/phosphatidylglycerophosphate/cardiolipin synthase-like enzyme
MKSTSIDTPRIFLALVALAALLAWSAVTGTQESRGSNLASEVYFSPHGGAELAVSQALDKAKSIVLVQAYSFTSVPIADALIRAHKREVRVQVLLDRSQKTQKYSVAEVLVKAGILVKIDAAHLVAHNKIMIIDGITVITGSFNFTKTAEERNAENVLVIHNKQFAAQYSENWRRHAAHSEVYNSKAIRIDQLTTQKNRAHFKD